MKKCSKCNINKDESHFHKDITRKDGLNSSCKECKKPNSKTYYSIHRKDRVEYAKNYREKNTVKIIEYREKTKEQKSISGKLWYQQNKEVRKAYYESTKHIKRDKEYKKKYGISLEEYEILLNSQNGVCAICGNLNKTDKRLAVDHDHKTGKVRGLLCSSCNILLGNAQDNIIILKTMIKYLESAGGVFVNG